MATKTKKVATTKKKVASKKKTTAAKTKQLSKSDIVKKGWITRRKNAKK